MATYNETLTKLRDTISDIKAAMNSVGMQGSDPMSTWPDQIKSASIPSDLQFSSAAYAFAYGRIDLLTYIGYLFKSATSWKYAFYQSYFKNDETYKIMMLSLGSTDGYPFTEARGSGGKTKLEVYTNNPVLMFKDLGKYGNYDTKFDIVVDMQTYDPTGSLSYNSIGYMFENSNCVNSINLKIDYSKIRYARYVFDYMNKLSSYKTSPDINDIIENLQWEQIIFATQFARDTAVAPFTEHTIHLTSACTTCEYMFCGISNSSINNIHFIFDNVKCNCQYSLAYINNSSSAPKITSWNNGENDIYVDKIGTYSADCKYMFAYSPSLRKIRSDNPLDICNPSYMCDGCNALEELPVINRYVLGTYMDAMEYAFRNCYALKEVTINTINPNNIIVYDKYAFQNCYALTAIHGDLYLSNISTYDGMFSKCTSLETIDTTGSFGGLNSTASMTLDISESPAFNASDFLTKLASNDSGKTRIIKLNSTVYDNLDDETFELAAEKNYTLAS